MEEVTLSTVKLTLICAVILVSVGGNVPFRTGATGSSEMSECRVSYERTSTFTHKPATTRSNTALGWAGLLKVSLGLLLLVLCRSFRLQWARLSFFLRTGCAYSQFLLPQMLTSINFTLYDFEKTRRWSVSNYFESVTLASNKEGHRIFFSKYTKKQL